MNWKFVAHRKFKIFYGLILLYFLISLTVSSEAETRIELDDFFKYPQLAVGEDNIYIWDDPFEGVFIYSRKDFQRLGRFSQQGRGPGDLTRIHDFIIGSEWIFINSPEKISYYSFLGQLLKEYRKDPGYIGLVPIGNNFVCKDYTPFGIENIGVTGKRLLSVILLNSKFEKKKDLYQFEYSNARIPKTNKRNVSPISGCRKYIVENDRIYIADTKKGFFFVVFNAKGKKLVEINKNVEERKVTNHEKKRLSDDFRNFWGNRWDWWKSRFNLVFPKYYPSYLNYSVYNKKIFIIMYPNMLENTQIILITNEKGHLLKEKKIRAIDHDIINNNQYYIFKEDMYYLKANVDTGNYFIHIVSLTG